MGGAEGRVGWIKSGAVSGALASAAGGALGGKGFAKATASAAVFAGDAASTEGGQWVRCAPEELAEMTWTILLSDGGEAPRGWAVQPERG